MKTFINLYFKRMYSFGKLPIEANGAAIAGLIGLIAIAYIVIFRY